MSKTDRVQLISDLEAKRNTKVLTYITSYRPGLEVQMAIDTIRKFYEHLRLIQESAPDDKPDIDLFIVSNGGDGTVPWRLVTLIREYCKKFSVLVPFRAFSAATLTALGADEIVMHPMGMLGPTDPTVANDFNPINPATGRRSGISVEDVTAYIALIKEDAGITHEDELVIAFNKLAEQVHPLALGNVKRSISQSRLMARKLLSLHMNKAKEQHDIQEIVDNLTSKLYFHGHPINRTEATEDLGLKKVKNPTPEIEKLMWNLFLEYETELKSEEPFNPVSEFVKANLTLPIGTANTLPLSPKLVYIESALRTDYLEIGFNIYGERDANGAFQVTPNETGTQWKVE